MYLWIDIDCDDTGLASNVMVILDPANTKILRTRMEAWIAWQNSDPGLTTVGLEDNTGIWLNFRQAEDFDVMTMKIPEGLVVGNGVRYAARRPSFVPDAMNVIERLVVFSDEGVYWRGWHATKEGSAELTTAPVPLDVFRRLLDMADHGVLPEPTEAVEPVDPHAVKKPKHKVKKES